MAAVAATADMTIEKNSEILVKVDEALADLLVVSYSIEDRKFQGVLLDSNKGNLPFGVYSLHPAFTKQNTSSDTKNDKLHSASQRFLYQEPQYSNNELPATKKPGTKGRPQQKQKMTVRLRPRKVLCSNCQGICNENSENVDVKKRKLGTSDDDNTLESISRDAEKKFLMGSMLIPKLSRLHPNEISNAIKSSAKTKAETDHVKERVTQELAFVDVKEDINMNCEESTKDSFNTLFSNAKRLKICFGEGEGTVVKIPPINGDNEDSGVFDMKQTKQLTTKAAKKALKKAKRQAKKNELVKSCNRSPKHIGALSPRNNVDPPNNEAEKKHKVKHKKKSRIARDENSKSTGTVDDSSVNYFSNIKDFTKLSINLRRMSCNSYDRNHESGSEEWERDSVPDFPATEPESVTSSTGGISAGDIVWGKLVGFPWWPGRVVTVTPMSQAHVAWYASTKSSLMPCDSLCSFLDEYKTRFNKKHRGAYKEAVKQAMMEAKKRESEDPLGGPTLLDTSQRPINVFS